MAKLTNFMKGQIVAYDDCGFSGREIAKKIGKSQPTVTQFLKSFKSTGKYERKPGTGIIRKTTKIDDKNIVHAVKGLRTISAIEITRQLNMVDISPQTIRNRLHEAGYHAYFQVKKPFISNINQQKRLQWAKDHVSWSVEQWGKVLWSDESPYMFRCNVRKRVWRLPTERYCKPCIKGTVKQERKIMIWGCFTAHGVGNLYKVNGIMNKEQYRQILIRKMVPAAKKLFPNGDYMFQHDNDPKHTAKIITKYLQSKNIITLDWPSQSPDLNPIENLWSFLDKQVENRNATSEDELFQVLQNGWNSLPTTLIRNLVESMPRRCQGVIDNEGRPTKY